ncbi:MAG: phosphoadenosine phosphosulfate reductase family protein, partial [Thermoplasmatota archaeon]
IRKQGGDLFKTSGFSPSRGYVEADEGAIPYILQGSNLLSPGVMDADPGIEPGDEVLVIDRNGKVIGAGSARKRGSDMIGTRGPAVKMRWASDPEDDIPKTELKRSGGDWQGIWERVVEINKPHLDAKAGRSISFIRNLIREREIPYAVSFSGGKDSLATLLLVMEAGYRPPLLFVDTGIEFPETVSYVHETADRYELELIEERPVSGFFENLPRFGPPGRDFRWCCKSSKLGPMTRIINGRFPGGVLTFIGQRRYESSGRKEKGSVWKNPWVPMQTGASPVQNWTALEVWLYIFRSGAPYNGLYEQGFNRIGCWLCPSTDMAERELIGRTAVDPAEWDSALEKERKRRNLPDEWIRYGFHRFKRLPPSMEKMASDMDLDLRHRIESGGEDTMEDPIILVEGSRSCKTGLNQEGRISENIPWTRFGNLLNIIGEVTSVQEVEGIEIVPPGWSAKLPALEVYRDGALILRGIDERDLDSRRKALVSVSLRSTGCIGCGVCVGRCPIGALSIDTASKTVMIDGGICIHCGSCLGPCPAEDFRDDPFQAHPT